MVALAGFVPWADAGIRATSRVYTGSNGLRCRRFREVISLRGGRREVIEGERCQKPDGTWIYVE